MGDDDPFPGMPPRHDNPIDLLRVPCIVQRIVVRCPASQHTLATPVW